MEEGRTERGPLGPLRAAEATVEKLMEVVRGDDDWFEKLPPLPPYVYNPPWAKDFPHLVGAVLSPEDDHRIHNYYKLFYHCDTSTSSSSSEEEVTIGGGPNGQPKRKVFRKKAPKKPPPIERFGKFEPAPQTKLATRAPPSSKLTATRYKDLYNPLGKPIKPTRLFVGAYEDPTQLKQWSPSIRGIGLEPKKPGEGEDPHIEYKYENYPAKYYRKTGLSFTSFVPPLPTAEEIRKARSEQGISDPDSVQEDEEEEEEDFSSASCKSGRVSGRTSLFADEDAPEFRAIESRRAMRARAKLAAGVPQTALSHDERDALRARAPNRGVGAFEPGMEEELLKMRRKEARKGRDQGERRLCPKLPFKAAFHGFSTTGYAVLRFNDKATTEQYELYEKDVGYFFGTTAKPLNLKKSGSSEASTSGGGEPDLVFGSNKGVNVPPGNIRKDLVVFVKWPEPPTKPRASPSPAALSLAGSEPAKGKPERYARARITSVFPEKNEAWVRDMDTWEDKLVPFTSIFYIAPTFLQTPFLLHKCRLKGLEFWSRGAVFSELCHLLPLFDDNVEVTEFDTGDDGVPIVSFNITISQLSRRHKLAKAEVMSINALLTSVIKGFTRIPKHFFRGTMVERAHVSIVDADGRAWVAMHSALAVRLGTIGESPSMVLTSQEYNESLGTNEPLSDFEFSFYTLGDRRFLARFQDDRSYYRVDVKEYTEGSNKIVVQYIDFGNTETIPLEDVIPTALVDPLLNAVAPQCFDGYLNGIESVTDIDEFFEVYPIQKSQKITLAGFLEPDRTNLLDVHVLMDKTTPADKEKPPMENWVYLNQHAIDNGIATMKPTGLHPYKPLNPKREREKAEGEGVGGAKGFEDDRRGQAFLPIRSEERSLDPEAAARRAQLALRGDKYRYYTSCRIDDDENTPAAVFEYKRLRRNKHDMDLRKEIAKMTLKGVLGQPISE